MATIVSDTVLQILKSLSFQEKDTCTLDVHCGTVYNSQGMETT